MPIATPIQIPAATSGDNRDGVRPETFRLPRPGERDPYFGLPRTAYYELEKAGEIRLVRLRKRGYLRGTTLIPFDQVLTYIRGAMGAPEALTPAMEAAR